MRIVLVHPQIPQNAGNIARTCAVIGAQLTFVTPLGFSMSSRHMRRSGLDYWDQLDLQVVDSLDQVLAENPDFWLFSSKGTAGHCDVSYSDQSTLIFGSETEGIPAPILEQYADRVIRIPMREGQRCLNLSNAVAVGAYEAWRQCGFI